MYKKYRGRRVVKRTKKRERLENKLLSGELKIWQVKRSQRDRIAYIYAIRYARLRDEGYEELIQIEKVLLYDILKTQDDGLKQVFFNYFAEERNGGVYIWKREKDKRNAERRADREIAQKPDG